MSEFSIGDKVQIKYDEKIPEHLRGKVYTVVSYGDASAPTLFKAENDENMQYLWDHWCQHAIQPAVTEAVKPATAEEIKASTEVTASALVDDIIPQRYIVSVQFFNDAAINRNRRYEYLAFGTFEELTAATHAVVNKTDHTDMDDILQDEELKVVRILDVYPTTQQRFNGKLRWIVDFVDGAEFVNRNMREQKAQQLRKDIKKRIEELTAMQILEETVKKSNDPKAAELFRQLKELGDE